MIAEYQTGVTSMGHIALKHGFERTAVYAAARRYGLSDWKRRPFNRLRRDPQITIPTDPATLGYVAGLLDGEGHIGRYFINGKYPLWRAQITNTFLPTLEWLTTIFTVGTISISKREPYLPCGHWQIHTQIDTLRFLQAVQPWLQIKADVAKRAIAELVLRFDEAIAECKDEQVVQRERVLTA
jgi:hypothetical protein